MSATRTVQASPFRIVSVSLARTAREIRPDAAILLTSGYLGEASPDAVGEFALIDKPYERSVLAAKLREVCGGRRRAKKAAATV